VHDLAVLFIDDFLSFVDNGVTVLIVHSFDLVMNELTVLFINNVFSFVYDWLTVFVVDYFRCLPLVVDNRLALSVRNGLLLIANPCFSEIPLRLLTLICLHILIRDNPLTSSFLLVLVMLINHFRILVVSDLNFMDLNFFLLAWLLIRGDLLLIGFSVGNADNLG
jgi:hypothetical protein